MGFLLFVKYSDLIFYLGKSKKSFAINILRTLEL